MSDRDLGGRPRGELTRDEARRLARAIASVRRVQAQLAVERETLAEAVAEAVERGASTRVIAEAIGLSATTVRSLVEEGSRD